MNKISLIGMLICISAYLQPVSADTIDVVMIGLKKGEKYKIYYHGTLVKKIKCRGAEKGDMAEFSLVGDKIPTGELIPMYVYRKGPWGLCYRNTELYAMYNPGKKYLILHRNYRLKNRYAIDEKWMDEKPARE